MAEQFVPVTVPEIERAVIVWRYADAPESLRVLSPHGGDEDWLALVPPSERGWIGWAEMGTPFGVCNVSETALPYGFRVFIGAHA